MNKQLTFDNFETEETNIFAFHAFKATIEKLGELYNPLFLYGANEKDKNHLLNASANYISDNTDKKLLYITGKELINDLNDSKIDKYENIDILIVEDIQELEENENIQKEFLNIFNNLYNKNKQMIISSSKKSDELSFEDKLKSRLQWGLSVDVFN